MKSQAVDNRRKRSQRQKHSPKASCDSESETAVTSTSGKKIKFPASPNMKRSQVGKQSFHLKKNVTSKMLSSLKPESKAERLPQPTRHQPASSTAVRDKVLPIDGATPETESISGSGNQRLLMREWLIQEVSSSGIPELKWLDENCTLLSIPWIHASKDGWSQDHHCKLFEKWAIYSGKYDPNKDKAEPKRWKANFRCALNSLRDVVEVPDQGQKNGMNGFKVYRFEDPVIRKSPRKCKLHSENIKQNNAVKVSVQAMLSNPSVATDSNCEGQSTDFDSRPLIIAEPMYAKTAHNTELVYDAVPSGDQSLALISSVGGDGDVGNSPEIEATLAPSFIPGTYSSEKDIIVLRNMDHNYFKLQIPTTVENYEDDENPSLNESQLGRTLGRM